VELLPFPFALDLRRERMGRSLIRMRRTTTGAKAHIDNAIYAAPSAGSGQALKGRSSTLQESAISFF
ncbi:MAG: hypothetical protein WAK13_15515, partial [Terriglobales bacterium]